MVDDSQDETSPDQFDDDVQADGGDESAEGEWTEEYDSVDNDEVFEQEQQRAGEAEGFAVGVAAAGHE
ncbi:MAG: hypothetical protein ABEN55_06975, partial [Bradymonadaceae bacterium]